MANRITAVAIDCADPEPLAAFWTQVLGWHVVERAYDNGVVVSIGSADSPLRIDFPVVPDGPKQTKNRVHIDVNPTDRDQDAELERLLALGAKEADIGQGDVPWYVLADPEGNEFRLLPSRVEP
jgi:catechol 2,3-dioxygenase-like lactoylglutathione lyase family enzyme